MAVVGAELGFKKNRQYYWSEMATVYFLILLFFCGAPNVL